ncbi:MAG TPA: ion transporter [Thermodesulfobacteriota bacterium]
MVELCRRIAEHPAFQHVILVVILVNAVVIGFETSPAVMARWGGFLLGLGTAIQALFVVEILVRLVAYWPRLGRFFTDGWNVFDFLVVAISLAPQAGPFSTVVRLARVLRVARLLSVVPELRLIIGTMLRSIPSMGHVIALLSLLLYIYAVVGFYLFGRHDPSHWGSLSQAFLTLFQMLTLEGWVEIQATSMEAVPLAWIYYASFVVVAVFVVINLFIAVVLNNLERAKDEEQAEADRKSPQGALIEQVERLKAELARLERDLRASGRS